MLSKIRRYAWTIRYLKPEQIFWRIGKRLGLNCAVKGASPGGNLTQQRKVALPELDYDPVFLNRFSVEELINDRITLLHAAEDFSWE